MDGRENSDSLLGGAGRDVFIFSGNTGDDLILDFVSGTDKIDLRTFGIDFSDVQTIASGTDTLIDVNTDDDAAYEFQIRLANASAPVESDYVFA